MKAKLRKEKKKQLRTSTSNFQNTSSENKSQDNIQNYPKKKKARVRSAEMTPGMFPTEKFYNYINNNNNPINNQNSFLSKNILETKTINKEEYREQELSKIATMFNFEIDKEKDIIKIKENEEYYDMRNKIIQLEEDLKNSEIEYDNLLNEYEKKNKSEREQIAELEKELKRYVDYDIEKIKKENITLSRDINLLDKKAESIYTLFQKEQIDMNSTIIELDNIIRKLKGEIYFVDDLKMRLKNLTSKDIPKELVESINYILKEDIAAQYRHTPSHSNVASVRSRTGTIPIADILDNSSLDSKKSIKKLYI